MSRTTILSTGRYTWTLFIAFLFISPIPISVCAQTIPGFTDRFENGTLDTLWNGSRVPLWVADFSRTFALTEGNGVLTIDYNRDAQSGPWDQFYFQPPADIVVTQNPQITIDINSSVATVLTLKPIYNDNSSGGWIQENLPGDNQWHSYTFNLVAGDTLNRIYFYLDGGTTTPKSGTVQFDNFKIAGFAVNVSGLKATLADSSHVDLSWSVDKPDVTHHFNIYRSTSGNFTANSSTLIGDTTATIYHDRGLLNNTTYYYMVAAVDTTGEEHVPSGETSIRTRVPGIPPTVTVDSTNSNNIQQYEKFEVVLDLQDASYNNPYDPDQIDVHAYFKSPKGDTTWVNGFYDDYNNAQAWKVRFSPGETGSWEYQVFATTPDGTGKSAKKTFTATKSDQHGWLTISSQNPNYLSYTDSTSFYGLAAYYPWNVTESGLDELKQHDVNIIGYWNSTYDNAGNGGGTNLIESMNSGLGRYDQQKCGRIDQILSWLNARHMKMMFAIWAHDYLSLPGQPWNNARYTQDNPYSTIVSAGNFYGDSLAWVYQKKLYRYIIARWGYSENLGIWEIINEIHGTTGYVQHPDQAIAWVNKVHAYFKDHDPHKRATTASFGSSTIWSGGSIDADMPNRHYYEAQGYPRPYGNNVRDGLYDAVNEMKNLKKAGNRPAIFGEAGYTSMFSSASSSDYTYEMHNAFWAGLTNGLASTPFWWDFTTKSVYTPERLDLYNKLSAFTDSLYLANSSSSTFTVSATGIDGYGVENDSTAFGWMYSYGSSDLSDTPIKITNLHDGTYAVTWYDTWSGTDVAVDTAISVGHLMNLMVPKLNTVRSDIAFRMKSIPGGTNGTTLNLFFKDDNIVATTDAHYEIVAYVTDDEGRLVTSQSHNLTFTLTGPGSLSTKSIKATSGIAVIQYFPPSDLSGGSISITVQADGLTGATINKMVTDVETSNQQSIPDKFDLGNNYPNPFNPTTNIKYSISNSVHVQLSIYNILGQRVATLVDRKQTAGRYQILFDANRFSSGVYLYRLTAGDFIQTKKMTLLK